MCFWFLCDLLEMSLVAEPLAIALGLNVVNVLEPTRLVRLWVKNRYPKWNPGKWKN